MNLFALSRDNSVVGLLMATEVSHRKGIHWERDDVAYVLRAFISMQLLPASPPKEKIHQDNLGRANLG